MHLANKRILVTGAGSGMGRELVLGLLKRNASVVAVDINEASLNETKQLAGESANRMTTYVVNMADRAAVEQMAQTVVATPESIDGIINNAGIIQPFVRVNDLSFEAIDRVMQVNFYGPLYLIKAVLPTLLKRPVATITNISSMGGFLPVPGQSVYGASKAAIKLLTEGLYAELRNTPVEVNVVFPGAINTNITKNSGVAMPNMPAGAAAKAAARTLSASGAAEQILKGIERHQIRIFVGRDSKLMNFLYRVHPIFATNFIAKQMQALLK